MTETFLSPPLAADHWMVIEDGWRCAKCHERFKAGERTSLIPVMAAARDGRAPALPIHARCLEEMLA